MTLYDDEPLKPAPTSDDGDETADTGRSPPEFETAGGDDHADAPDDDHADAPDDDLGAADATSELEEPTAADDEQAAADADDDGGGWVTVGVIAVIVAVVASLGDGGSRDGLRV